jgi:hypothetical protein
MDPVYHHLMESQVDRSGYSSLRNPDGFFPERDAIRPDPLGSWFVAALDRFADRLSSWRSRRDMGRLVGAGERKGGALTAVEVE